MATEKMTKNDKYYSCDFCDFKTCKKTNFDLHLQTQKHLRNSSATFSNNLATEKMIKCDKCKKTYNDRTGLWRHKKICNSQQKIENEKNEKNENTDFENDINDINDKELIVMLIKQNSELMKETSDFKSMMMEVIKNGTHNTTHTNSHNKAFNLNFFLNETCKDAMNIMDFVDSIKLQLSDLEKVGEIGYVEGISNIIVKNLKDLDVNKRPVHCTDKKRETMYIKDDNKWEKDEERLKLHKVVRKVACKNQNLIPRFKEKHPDCGKYNSKFSDQYNKIIVESMGGSGDNDFEKEEKIIKNISKEIIIDKEAMI
jgi:hypothetical protein